MKLNGNEKALLDIRKIISYFLTSHITSFKFYGDDDGIFYSIENKIIENIYSKLEEKVNKEGLFEMNAVVSAIQKEMTLLSIYRYFDIGDSSIDDDYNGVLALYVLDYKNKEYKNEEYANCSSRCDIFNLTELEKDKYNNPSSIVLNKDKPYEYLFGSMKYLVGKMLYVNAKSIEFRPQYTTEDGGFRTEIKILDENGNLIESIKSNGSSVYSLYEAIECRIKDMEAVKVIADESGKKYSFPQPSYSEDGLHLVLSEENWQHYQKWNEQLELSYTQAIENPTKDVFSISLEYETIIEE